MQSRYYDPDTGRFISPDNIDVIGATPMDLTDKNLFAYCDNNPVMRVDESGEWWIFANAFVGAVVGAVVKITTNLAEDKNWYEGVVGAAVGGAVYNTVVATTGSVAMAGYISAGAESLVNEVSTYVPIVSNISTSTPVKQLTMENVGNSVSTIVANTVINGTVNAITVQIASQIVPTNSGWFHRSGFQALS